MTASTATAATATISTITEVSMRQPCQVMATSPGRSANQTAPNGQERDDDEIDDDADHRGLASLLAGSFTCRAPPARRRRGAGSPRRRPARASACLIQASRRRAHVGRQLGQLGERAGEIGVRGLDLDARDDRARIGARHLLDRADAHELLGVRRQAGRASRRRAARRRPPGRARARARTVRARASRPTARRSRRTARAARAPWDPARAASAIASSGANGSPRSTALAQRRGGDREPHRAVGGALGRTLGKLGLDRLFAALDRGDAASTTRRARCARPATRRAARSSGSAPRSPPH